MADGAFTVQIVGQLSKTVRAACHRACREAGMRPTSLILTGPRSAVAYGEASPLPLFIRWTRRATDWTYDPAVFSAGYKRRNMRRMVELLSDPAAPHKRVLCGKARRGKTALLVS